MQDKNEVVIAYDIIVAFVMSVGALCSVTLLALIYKARYSSVFNICIFLMTVGLIVYDVLGLIFEFLNTYFSSFLKGGGVAADTLIVFYVLRAFAGVLTYFFSSILSYSIYHLIKHKLLLDLSSRSRFRFIAFIILLVIATAYLTTAFLEKFSSNSSLRVYLASHGFMNIVALIIKVSCVIYNFINYLVCEHMVKRLFYTSEQQLLSDVQSKQFAAIKALMRRVRLYPLLQFVSIFPYVVYGFVNQLNWNNINQDVFNSSATVIAFYIIGEFFLWANSIFMVIIYFKMNPDSLSKLKDYVGGLLFCCESSYETTESLLSRTTGGDDNGSSANEKRSSIPDFSDYRFTNVPDESRTELDDNLIDRAALVAQSDKDYNDLDVDGLDDDELVHIVNRCSRECSVSPVFTRADDNLSLSHISL